VDENKKNLKYGNGVFYPWDEKVFCPWDGK